MIPANMRRGASSVSGKLPLPVLIALAVAGVVVLVFAGVALTMGTPPAQQDVTVELPLKVE